MKQVADLAPGIRLARGVCAGLAAREFACLTEMPVRTGRRMDVLALGSRGEVWCVEVKSSRADFMADAKWPEYLEWCDRLFFAVPEGFCEDLLPPEHGLIRADPWDCEVMRIGRETPLAPARRKTLTLRFAHLAAARLARQDAVAVAGL